MLRGFLISETVWVWKRVSLGCVDLGLWVFACITGSSRNKVTQLLMTSIFFVFGLIIVSMNNGLHRLIQLGDQKASVPIHDAIQSNTMLSG